MNAQTNLPVIHQPPEVLADDFSNAFKLHHQASYEQAAIARHMRAHERAAGHRPLLPPKAVKGGLSASQQSVLGVLEQHGPCTIAQIEDHLGWVPTGAVRHFLGILRDRGLVTVRERKTTRIAEARVWEAVPCKP